jgi:hypothetical protein
MTHDVADAPPGRSRFLPRYLTRIATFSRIILLVFLAAFPISSAIAQDNKGEAQLRTVHGTTVDKDDNPVSSSVVYLLNVKTQSIITRITDGSGAYRFSGLDPNVDYQVHAEHNDLASSTRTISSFDSRRDIEVILKLSHKKSAQ